MASDIEGRVRAGDGGSGGIGHATIELLHQHFVVTQNVLDSNGRFAFHDLAIGTYQVRIRAQGFRDQEIFVDLVRPVSREVLEIRLSRVEESFAAGSTVSVHQLNIPAAAKRDYRNGLEEQKRKQCGKAVPHFQKAIAAYAQYGEAYNELGNCLKETGRLTEAEESFRKAMEYTSSVYPAMNLADLYSSQKRFAESREVLRKTAIEHPSEGDPYFGMAKLHFDQDQINEAVAMGLQAHQKTHRMADVHLLLAQAYLRLEDHQSVAEQLRLYLEEHPDGPVADQARQALAGIRTTSKRP